MIPTSSHHIDLPAPFPDTEFYNETLEAGFSHFPDRKKNYLKYKASQRGLTLDYLPVRMDIENVSRCNYRCTMCQVSEWPNLKRADDMAFEDYKELLDSQIGLTEIKLQGMGEPLLGKCYSDMIEYARNRHIWVRSTTNASLLHLRDNYKRVIDADICELQVSFDGATPETYEKIRLGGKFNTVSKNCRLLNDYGIAVNRIRTRMWVVVQKDNLSELALFPKLASELGFDRLTFSMQLNDWGQEHWRTVNQALDVGDSVDPSSLISLVDIGQQHGVAVTFWSVDHKYQTGDPSGICPWPFDRAYISSDMRFVPCCIVANPEVLDLGDARKLTQEWNGQDMVAFRKAHLEGRIPDMCRICYKTPTPPAE